jgi:hypothetical protein
MFGSIIPNKWNGLKLKLLEKNLKKDQILQWIIIKLIIKLLSLEVEVLIKIDLTQLIY